MSDIAIRVEGLSKQYRIGQQERYLALRDILARSLSAPIRWFKNSKFEIRNSKSDYIWALKDISFEVKQGEVVGIIGRNGAGKTTLLKILSRITEPTEGHAEIHGRVRSLLEVGTGFHPELTGRENIYLNGAILGMKKAEIDRKFDEIVAFAEVEKFIDTPVKHYSSGMHVRLAFAVAAHLEPEILLVDEVLAVGDAVFQKKCLGKMGDVAKEGRTVLFVSHNMGAIQHLCPTSILLNEGRMVTEGDTTEVVSFYLNYTDEEMQHTAPGHIAWPDEETAPGNDDFKLIMVRLVDPFGQPRDVFEIDKPILVEIVYKARKPLRGMRIGLSVLTADGVVAFASTDHNVHPPETVPGIYCSICKIPGSLLNRGRYSIEINADIPGVQILLRGQGRKFLSFTADGIPQHGSFFPDAKWQGVVCPHLEWYVKQI